MNKFFEILAAQQINRILVIGLVLTAAYWKFIYDDGSAIDAQIATVEQSLQAEENKKKDTDATLKQVKEMQEKVGLLSQKYEQISKKLPSSLFSADINKSIDDFARNAGVSVKLKKPASNIKSAVVEEVPVEISLEGSYSQLAHFTYLVSASEKMARVKNITLSESGAGTSKLKFDAEVVGYKLAAEEKKKPQTTETPQ